MRENGEGFKVKVVERCGVNLRSQLPGLKTPSQCKENCIVHSTGGKGPCTKPGAVYKGQCLTCREVGPASEPLPDGTVR